MVNAVAEEAHTAVDEPRRRSTFSAFGSFVGLLAGAIALLIAYPLIRMMWIALTGGVEGEGTTLGLIAETFSDPGMHIAVRNTAIVLAVSMAITIPIGVLFAWLNERTDAEMGMVSRLFPVLPLLLPPVALAIGWLFLGDPKAGFIFATLQSGFGALGIEVTSLGTGIASWPGLIAMYVIFLVPQVYVVVAAAFRSIDPSLEEAARVNGRGQWYCFLRIAVPAVRPSIGSVSLLIFIAGVSLYSIPAILGSASQITVLSTYIYRLLYQQYPARTDKAILVGLAMIIVISVAWALERRSSSKAHYAQMGGMGVRPNRIELGRGRRPARMCMIGYIVVTSLLPIVALVIVSLQGFWSPRINLSDLSLANLRELFDRPLTRNAIRNSAILGLAAATIATLIAILLATYSADTKGVRGRAVGVVTKVPAAISNLVFALALLVAIGFAPFYLSGTLTILFIAYGIVFLPQVSIAAESALRQIGPDLMGAARMCGAGRGRTLRQVVLPLSSSGLAAGWTLVFAIIIGDLSVAAILSGPRNPVIGYRILQIFENGNFSQLAALSVFIVVLSAAAVGAVLTFARPRFGRGRSQ